MTDDETATFCDQYAWKLKSLFSPTSNVKSSYREVLTFGNSAFWNVI